MKDLLFKINMFTFFLTLSALTVFSQGLEIIPQPYSIHGLKGDFVIDPATTYILADSNTNNVAEFFIDYLKTCYHINLGYTYIPKGNCIKIRKGPSEKYKIKGEYLLEVRPHNINIESSFLEGCFYGIQSLIQLLPIDLQKETTMAIPAAIIKDRPAFPYRGMHLDVGRHFFSVSFIKKYIDYISYHKMNYFHWHLTEDQGWRVEIKKYPLLTEVGSCRKGTMIGSKKGNKIDTVQYCGYYTQSEIKDIVAYAKKRYVTIIPEIEMPGHSSAALASYPSLGCPGLGPYKVEESWGVFEDVYCAGNDSVFIFLQNVLDEVIELFPSPYIHIGGDECPKHNWRKCNKCLQRMAMENLKNVQELQSYFIRKIEKYLNSKGRTIIGWDEILDGGIAPNATVMSWRGNNGGIRAAQQKHEVIMTPADYVYLDHAQKSNDDSINIGGLTTLETVYSYNPIPEILDSSERKYILGSQGNVWTEYMKSPEKVEYMIFPRMSALSEVLWTPTDKKSWIVFYKKMEKQYKRYLLWKAFYYLPK